jgi:hypothetical protein
VVGYFAGQLLIPPSHSTPAPVSTTPAGATGGAGAAAAGTGATGTGTPTSTTSTPATGATAGGSAAGGPSSSTGAPNSHAPLTAFTDRAGGFYMSYPKGWTRLTSSDAGVRLLASGPDGASLLVRLATLGVTISGKTLDELATLTTSQLRAEHGVEIVAGPRLLSVNSLPGFLIIYSYIDPTTKQRAAHSQITLFSGKRMYTLVYQADPAASLITLAPLFDQVTDTFHA